MTTFTMKLQSPDFDGAGNGYEIPLPINMDSHNLDSMATILSLFDGKNKTLDFRQLKEVVTLTGILTVQSAAAAGFANPVQMRDELRRIRASIGDYGLNTGSAKSWLQEGSSGFAFHSADWGNGTLPVEERDGNTNRNEGTVRLIYDQYWRPSASAYKSFFLYGTVSGINFGPRPAATTQTRIPFSVTFLIGDVKLGSK